VRTLEDAWGLRLFLRDTRSVTLSRNGQVLLPVVLDCFERVGETVRRLRADDAVGPLRVSLLQSFAVRWLLPRLPDFRARHPGIEVWLATSSDQVNFEREDVDVAIRLGTGSFPGLHSTPILTEEAFPVCSPAYLQTLPHLPTPADLLVLPLIQVIAPAPGLGWTDWFESAGLAGVNLPDGPHVSDSALAIQAALDGQGVAFGRTSLVVDDLAAGRLVKLFDVVCRSGSGYHFVCRAGRQDSPKIAAFRTWLIEKAHETRLRA
jgi:LysR family glycine cleavage system transcriptional activator